VEEIVIEGDYSEQRLTAKKALLQWARQNMDGYETNVNNFTKDWSDGMAFNVIIHRNKYVLFFKLIKIYFKVEHSN
jgi:hypothetical protein